VDDILLLGGAFFNHGKVQFKSILDQFLLVSGGLVNSNKCYLYAWNTSAHSLVVIARILQFPLVMNWRSFKYLGIPICLNSLSVADWEVILIQDPGKILSVGGTMAQFDRQANFG
jgi:hypothetical protein